MSDVKGIKYVLVSEPDEGIYDALNKGIKLATGDVIGLLHSDDIYFDENVLAKVALLFEEKNVGSVYGDLVYVDKKDTTKVFRYWKAGSLMKINYARAGCLPIRPFLLGKKFTIDTVCTILILRLPPITI